MTLLARALHALLLCAATAAGASAADSLRLAGTVRDDAALPLPGR